MDNCMKQAKVKQSSSGHGVCVSITPDTSMHMLSQHEVEKLCDTSQGGLHELFRNSALAVLTSGNDTDDTKAIFARYADFDIALVQRDRGVKLELINAPGRAFVDGEIIQGIKEHLFSVLRDIIYVHNEIQHNKKFDLTTSNGITNAIFIFCEMPKLFILLRIHIWWCAGVAIRSVRSNIVTPKKSGINWDCVLWIFVRAVGQGL